MLNVLDSGDSKAAPSQPLLINHNNNTGRWISPFRAVWTWDSRHVAVGSMNRVRITALLTIFLLQDQACVEVGIQKEI